MAGLWMRLLLLVLTVHCMTAGIAAVPHLKVRRILLPFNLDIPTNFTLEIEHSDGACFRWESSRTDVATVSPVLGSAGDIRASDPETDCSIKAVVTAVSRSKRRQSAVIYAKESNGGPVLTADVEVDAVHEIDIITRTREIAMDAYPEEFEVQARNDQNNTFSRLDGIEFEWDLKRVTTGPAIGELSGDGVSILRFRKAAEINKESNFWEERDRRGCTVHIEGVKTGTSRVMARIKDPAYAHVKPSEIQLIVHARIDLRPADSKHLLPFAHISYSVTILKNTQIKPLTLPSEQYFLEVTDPKVASLDTATSTVTALKEGTTTVVLRDRNIRAGVDMKPPTAELTVTKPSYLMFHIEPGTPGKEWALQELTHYVLTVEVYDVYHNRMFASANLALEVTFPPAFFKVIESSANGTYHYVQAVKQGSTRIKGRLDGARKADGTIGSTFKAIVLEQELSIYPVLQVLPTSVFLPWDQVVKPSYTIKLLAMGATGAYRWDSAQPSVASVLLTSRDTSAPKLFAKELGSTKVTVRDANNHVFVQQVPIEVADVVELEIIPGVVETQLDSSVFVNLALYGRSVNDPGTNRLFDNCTEIPLTVDIVEKTRFNHIAGKKAAIHPKACRALEFACIGVGHSRITVTYDGANGPISTTTIISCFMPLRLVYPDPVTAGVIALGTSIEVTFDGGPRKWPNHSDRDYFADLMPELPDIYEVREIVDLYRYHKDLHVYRVTCKSLGETVLQMRIGNRASATLPNPAIIQESVTLTCSQPIDLHVRPKMRKDDNCPKSFDGRKYPVSYKNPIEMEVTAWDVEKRRFLNFTSLELEWTLGDERLANMQSAKNFAEEVNGAAGYRRGTRNYQTIFPNRKEGDLIVSIMVSAYRADVLKSEKIANSKSPLIIQSNVHLLLVEKPAIDPSATTLFNHQKNQAILRVIRGSGFFKLDISEAESKTANVTFDDLNAYVTVQPKADGRVTVKVIDCCVVHDPGSSLPDAEASVRIVDPSEIRLSLNRKIQLGKETDVTVQVIGTSGDLIEANFHPLMNLHPILTSDIASIKELTTSDRKQSLYRIKAERLGSAGLVFKTGSSTSHLYKKVLESQEVKLHIFSPLSVSPANLKLIVGAHFEVTVSGGPQESVLEFSTPDAKTAAVSASGIVHAIALGSSSLTVKSVEKEVQHSVDKIGVEVLPLMSIKIASPLKQMTTGSTMNLILFGTGLKNEVLEPFAFASADPKLRISWTVSNTDVLDLFSVDSRLGVHDDGLNAFSVRVTGLREGTAVVRVSVEVTEEANDSSKYQIVGNRILSDNITIRISTKLVVNSANSGEILLTPGSELNLRSSRDGIDRLAYTVLNGENQVFIDKSSILKSLTSDSKDAVLQVKSSNGQGFTQISTYGVHIQPISYLLLVPQRSLDILQDYPKRLVSVPLGAVLRFDVNFYNIMGQKFDVVNVKPEIRLNRNGLLGYKWIGSENRLTLEFTASREGTTVVKVWLPAGVSGSNEMADYIKITVGQVVSPAVTEVPIGSVVCFHSPLTTPEGQTGSWNVDGEEAVFDFMNEKSGVAVALKSGKVRVKHNVTTFSTSSSEVLVVDNDGLMIESRGVKLLSNQGDSETRFPVVVRQDKASSPVSYGCSASNLKNAVSPFQCMIKFTEKETVIPAADVFSCVVEFNPDTNSFEVVAKNNDLTPEKREQVASLSSRIELLLLTTGQKVPAIPSIPLQLDFAPAFHVQQNEIRLSNHYPIQEIRISAVDPVLSSMTASAANEITDSILEVVRDDIRDSNGAVVGHRFFVQIRNRIHQIAQSPHSALQIKVFSSENQQTAIINVVVTWYLDKSQCIRVASDVSRIDTRSGLEYTRDLIFLPVNFVVDQHQFLVAVLLVAASLALVFHQYTKHRPVVSNPNFLNSRQASGHQPLFPQPSVSPTPLAKSPNNTATVFPHTAHSPFSTRSPFGSPLTQRRIATSDHPNDASHSLFNNSGSATSHSLFQESVTSPPRTSTSPKGVVGRPLWTSPRS